jgi:hypothetical protein
MPDRSSRNGSNSIVRAPANFQEFTFFIAKNIRRKYLSRERHIEHTKGL